MSELYPSAPPEMDSMWERRAIELGAGDELTEEEALSNAVEEYRDFIGSTDDEMKTELGGRFSRSEIRKYVEYANETGDVESRYTAACILWAFVYERETIKRPDIIILAISRIVVNGHDDWSDFEESIQTGVLEDALDDEDAKATVELVAHYGWAGHYPDGVSTKKLGLAVGTLAKLGNLELPNALQGQELNR